MATIQLGIFYCILLYFIVSWIRANKLKELKIKRRGIAKELKEAKKMDRITRKQYDGLEQP